MEKERKGYRESSGVHRTDNRILSVPANGLRDGGVICREIIRMGKDSESRLTLRRYIEIPERREGKTGTDNGDVAESYEDDGHLLGSTGRGVWFFL